MKYDAEARHWIQAFESERIRNKSLHIGEGSGVVTALITIAISLTTIIVLGLGWIFKRIFK